MKYIAIFLIFFGLIVIINPDILAYLIWWFFIFIWTNIFLAWFIFKSKKDSFVKFGDYKIFRGK